MRKCSKCGQTKDDDQFGPKRRTCKTCRREYRQQWEARSADKLTAYRRKYNAENSAENTARATQWQLDNPERRAEISLSYYYRLQDQCLMAYGGYRCACCGETEPLFLQLDHTNNNGNVHRKQEGISGSRLYRDLIKQGFPPGFQVLCANCNHGKHRNGGVCPHHEGATTIPKGSTPKRAEAPPSSGES